jgi:energy-coupling factor transport system permease protein
MKPGWAAVRHYPAFLAPLLIQAFQLAEELAEVMEARGFGRSGRTFSRSYKLKPRDWLAMGSAVATLTGTLALFGVIGL